mmetsp:Transcript_14961/g.43983  ORF Transcript_14961/g.43983 Transcript_14961/m.43983 type:complete len:200 (+) Transcript_14961:2020-2619(+)
MQAVPQLNSCWHATWHLPGLWREPTPKLLSCLSDRFLRTNGSRTHAKNWFALGLDPSTIPSAFSGKPSPLMIKSLPAPRVPSVRLKHASANTAQTFALAMCGCIPSVGMLTGYQIEVLIYNISLACTCYCRRYARCFFCSGKWSEELERDGVWRLQLLIDKQTQLNEVRTARGHTTWSEDLLSSYKVCSPMKHSWISAT